MTKIAVTQAELDEVIAVRDAEGIFRLPINADLSLRRADNSFGTAYMTTDPDVDLSGVNVKYLNDRLGGVGFAAYAADEEYSIGNIVYVLNSGVAHFYIYVNETATTGMNPETPANNTHWDALGVDEVTATQDGTIVEVHLARADNLLFNPDAGMQVAIENDNTDHSSLLTWEAVEGRLVLNVDGLVDTIAGKQDILALYSNSTTYSTGDIVRSSGNILYVSTTDNNTGNAVTNVLHWHSLGGATQFAPEATTAENLGGISVPDNTVGAKLLLSKNNNTDGLSPTPNRSVDIYGTGGITITAHGEEDVIVINGEGLNPDVNILDLETVFSFTDPDALPEQELVGYVTSPLYGTANVAVLSNGNWEISNHDLNTGDYYVVSWNNNWAVGLALSTVLFNPIEVHLAAGGANPTLNQEVNLVFLDNVQAQALPVTNEADIEAVIQHNHEQDARIAALENQDFTTTITSFDTSTVLTNLFTSGAIVNKGNINGNLYQAWTITREGHELIGYLQLTDTERDSFRSEFSLVEGSNSNLYVPANPDAPHTIGIKAFAAADYNDLGPDTQVMLGQISSMRFAGHFGAETQFEIRWELLNYSTAIDTSLDTVDSGQIYGAAGDQRYAFYANTLYTTPAWEFREATVNRTAIENLTEVTVNTTTVVNPIFLDNADADGIHIEVTNGNEIKFNLNHLPGAAYSATITYDPGDEVTFNGTIYIALSNQTGVPPIDGGSSNNVYHGVGAVPLNSGFAWRIAKAGITVGTFDPDTNVTTDEATAESIHFNSNHFVTAVDLTSGNEDISLVDGVLNSEIPSAGPATTGLITAADWNIFNGKQDAITTSNAESIRTLLNVDDGADMTPASVPTSASTVTVNESSTAASSIGATGDIIINVNADLTPAHGIYLDTTSAATNAIPKWNGTNWVLGVDEASTGGGGATARLFQGDRQQFSFGGLEMVSGSAVPLNVVWIYDPTERTYTTQTANLIATELTGTFAKVEVTDGVVVLRCTVGFELDGVTPQSVWNLVQFQADNIGDTLSAETEFPADNTATHHSVRLVNAEVPGSWPSVIMGRETDALGNRTYQGVVVTRVTAAGPPRIDQFTIETTATGATGTGTTTVIARRFT